MHGKYINSSFINCLNVRNYFKFYHVFKCLGKVQSGRTIKKKVYCLLKLLILQNILLYSINWFQFKPKK